jgi:hypothetical protein
MSAASSDSSFLNDDQDLIAQKLDQIIHSDTYKLAHHDLLNRLGCAGQDAFGD